MILKLGSQGDDVKRLQDFLDLEASGIFDETTKIAVKKWQKANGLLDDGVVGPLTMKKMELASTDITENPGAFLEEHFSGEIDDYLPAGEYFPGPYLPKQWMFIHHTAGWHKPTAVVSAWANDKRGPVATEFVIGGQSVKGNDNTQDGKLVHVFPAGGFGWHLGTGRSTMHSNSVAVEVCCFGQLTRGGYKRDNVWIPLKASAYYTYVGVEADPSQILLLPKAFRGYTAWHKYSDAQISTLKQLLLDVANRDGIDMRKGLPELIKSKGVYGAFDFCDVNYAMNHKGLWTHANVLKSKVDMFPQQELVDMILSL